MNETTFRRIQLVVIIALICGTIAIRFLHLGLHPLDENEAKLALQALATSKGLPSSWSGEPLYLLLTSVVFFLFDKTNFTARLIPAIFGSLFVLSPFLFRRKLGIIPTYFVVGFLMIDPAIVSLSRTAGGSTITLLTLMAGFYFLTSGNFIAAGISVGLLLLSGSGLWAFLLPALITFALWIGINRGRFDIGQGEIAKAFETVKDRRFLLSLVFSWVIVGTSCFIFPRSISGITGSIQDYFINWTSKSTLPYPVFLSGFIIYFPIGLILGFWGGIRSIIEKNRIGSFLFIWFLCGLLVTILRPDRDLTQLTWVVLPMYFLAAFELRIHFVTDKGEIVPTLGVIALVMCLTIFLWLTVVKFTYGGDQKEMLIAFGGGFGILFLSAILIILGWSKSIAGKGYFWGLLGILAIYTFSTGWRVSGISNIEQAEITGPQKYIAQLNLIDKTISDLSKWNVNSSTGIDVSVVGFNTKALEWGLKDYPNVHTGLSIPAQENAPVVLTMRDAPFKFTDVYRGEGFVFERSVDWGSFQLTDWIAWFVHRKAITIDNSIVLWARADLFPGGAFLPAQ